MNKKKGGVCIMPHIRASDRFTSLYSFIIILQRKNKNFFWKYETFSIV